VRNFAHDLRIKVWKKLFGITGKVRPASDLAEAIEAPGSPDSWRRIQAQAVHNAKAYEAEFKWIPRNFDPADPDDERSASILPLWNRDPAVAQLSINGAEPQAKTGPLPFDEAFWKADRANLDNVGALGSIKGFISALPIYWTRGENIHIKFPAALVTKREPSPLETTNQVAANEENKQVVAGDQTT